MTLQSANNRIGRLVAAALAGSTLSAGLALGTGVAVADDSMEPSPPTVAQAAPEAIVPNGVTGEAAKAAQVAASAPAAAPGDPANPAAAGAPGDPAAPDAGHMAVTPDQLLMTLSQEYDTGAGGGQVSKLVHSVLKLRAQGFKPSRANNEALASALDYRPNQGPLVAALRETLAYQQKQKSQNDTLQGNNSGGPFTIGINQADPNNPGPFGQFSITPGS